MTSSGSWFWQSVIAMVFLVPAWLSIAFFEKNYQIKPETFLVWYMLGTILYTAIFGSSSAKDLVPSWKIVFFMFVIGLTAGGIANTNIFRAVANANASGSNPGLPLAIGNIANVWVFIIAYLLYRWWPSHFGETKFDFVSFIFVVLTVVGGTGIALRR